MLPDTDGFELARALRERSDIPIMMLSARDTDVDKAVGLGVGADDYVTKPFSPLELVARVKAHLRRYAAARERQRRGASDVIEAGPVRIDLGRTARDRARRGRRADREGVRHPAHARRAPRARVHEGADLRARLGRGRRSATSSTVQVHVRRLRTKIEEHPDEPTLVTTVWGIGYRFEEGARDDAGRSRPRSSRSRSAFAAGVAVGRLRTRARLRRVAEGVAELARGNLAHRVILPGDDEAARMAEDAQRGWPTRSSASARPQRRATRRSGGCSRTSRTTCARRSPRSPGYVDALQRGLGDEPERYLAVIAAKTDELAQLTDDLFYAARLDAGDLELKRAAARPRRGGAPLRCSASSRSSPATGVRVDVDIPEDALRRATADPSAVSADPLEPASRTRCGTARG